MYGMRCVVCVWYVLWVLRDLCVLRDIFDVYGVCVVYYM